MSSSSLLCGGFGTVLLDTAEGRTCVSFIATSFLLIVLAVFAALALAFCNFGTLKSEAAGYGSRVAVEGLSAVDRKRS
jgi:hypothetical protein